MRVEQKAPEPPQPVRERQTPRPPEPKDRTMQVQEAPPQPSKTPSHLGRTLDVKA